MAEEQSSLARFPNEGERLRVVYPPMGEPSIFNSFTYSLRDTQERLIAVLQNFDEPAAQMIMGSVLSLYPLERVCTDLIVPTMWTIGQLWAEAKISASVEHFASFFFHSLLSNMFCLLPNPTDEALVIACCAPGETHDLPALMLALFLRRNKVRVTYLGQNIEIEGLLQTIGQFSPAAICVSLTIPSHISALIDLGKQIQSLRGLRPILTFSGQAFRQFPQYIALVPGTYIDEDIINGTEKITQLVSRYKNGKKGKDE
jgi:MerR family transcriptional regulator, light-induced transcriptional regulator